MSKQADVVCLSKSDALHVLSEIEILLISLRNMGNLYLEMDRQAYEHETTRFIDEWRVTYRLAKIRLLLSKPFGTELGPDNMGELERAMMGIRAWERPGDNPD